MNQKQVALLGALALLALFVGWLALRNPKPAFLPDDEVHATFSSARACLACHGPNGDVPQSRNHPVGNDCLRCHGFR